MTGLVERVQKGVRSGILEEGRLLGESEQLVARFMLVGSARLSDKPFSLEARGVSSRG